jgi:cytochrome c oxidase subunit I
VNHRDGDGHLNHDREHEHVHLPEPSVWPLTVGAGTSLMAFGVATSLALSAMGLVLLAWGLFGWIQELRHE